MEILVEDPEPAINSREFFAEYKKKITKGSSQKDSTVPFYFAATSPVSAEIEQSCHLENIASHDDNATIKFEPGIEWQRLHFVKPQTSQPIPNLYKAISLHKKSSKHNPFLRSQFCYRLSTMPPSIEQKLHDEYELEFTVRFYRPPRASHRGYKVEHPVFAEEFLCLGSQYLTDLRDKISCVCNGKQFIDISNDPEAPLPVLETNPAYFFIHDTFYNDTRNPKNCNYSETVLNWAPTALGKQGENFKVATMETTRFIDLTVSLGTPMQYLHHGNCEHLFVISQLQVLTPKSRCVSRQTFSPFMRSFNYFNRRTCFMCGSRRFYFIVEKSNRQPFDPTYLCRSCFYNFHYVDGKKIGEFKAYRIYDLSDEVENTQDEYTQSDHSYDADTD
ncbi:snRNA-activating protein complex subunit 3 [Scaptodrosophila lebanonensis]|uniref:snRNA-activating protein complex subunit 3 n=1 Tax=Drosophila lebanonensis TaxID=7225 RepID=A0A6J2TTQ2_DROLE|nr:snRNA-activating protein complex subunit 3 [Scaptodrosophila lebanonensis]